MTNIHRKKQTLQQAKYDKQNRNTEQQQNTHRQHTHIKKKPPNNNIKNKQS